MSGPYGFLREVSGALGLTATKKESGDFNAHRTAANICQYLAACGAKLDRLASEALIAQYLRKASAVGRGSDRIFDLLATLAATIDASRRAAVLRQRMIDSGHSVSARADQLKSWLDRGRVQKEPLICCPSHWPLSGWATIAPLVKDRAFWNLVFDRFPETIEGLERQLGERQRRRDALRRT